MSSSHIIQKSQRSGLHITWSNKRNISFQSLNRQANIFELLKSLQFQQLLAKPNLTLNPFIRFRKYSFALSPINRVIVFVVLSSVLPFKL